MLRITDQQNALLGITQDARRLLRALRPASTVSGLQQDLPPRHQLTIPLPQPITSLLLSRGLDSRSAEKLNRAYLDRALSLKQVYEDKHRQALEGPLNSGAFRVHDIDQFASASIRALVSRYQQITSDWQSKINEMIGGHIHELPETEGRETGAIEKRPTFKNESVPVLEKSFIINAYPSRTDKETLARVTGMEYKQVNIWFQNRRARSKKEGISLQRTATFVTQSHTPIRASISLSPEPRPRAFNEEHHVHPSEVRVFDQDVPKRSGDPFTLTARPTYTFPTPYPPVYDEDPFFFQTLWLRRCSTDPIRRSPVDIDHITAQMASLSLLSDIPSDPMLPIPSFTLVLPRAPLPALIRTVTALSRALPVATLVSAAGSTPSSKSKASKKRVHPTRLPYIAIDRYSDTRPSSLVASSCTIPIPNPRASTSRRLRRSETRSPSPPYSSRSSSSSSIASSRSVSSSSVASSAGPFTPSTSPRIETSSLIKDSPFSATLAHAHRMLGISDDVYVSLSFR